MDELKIDCLEERLLNILLNFPEKSSFIFSNCEKEFFNDFLNARIFEMAKQLYNKKLPVDEAIMLEYLEENEFNEITLKLFDIKTLYAPPSVQCNVYCKVIFEKYLKKLYANIKNKEDYERISELEAKYTFEENKTCGHVSDNIDNLINDYTNDCTQSIVSLYGGLDDCIGSFMAGDYIVCGAATSMGKTAFALNLARNVCIQDKTVLYFSMEMPLEQIQNRLICMQEGLNANKYRSKNFNLVEWDKFKNSAKELHQWPLYIIEDYGLTPEKMRQYLTAQKQKGLDFVVVDYLGLMSGYSTKSLYEKTTYLSRSMKLLASEFKVPIMCLVQLNRDSKTREDKRPKLSDIRESGNIEQDADVVLLLYREGYYDNNKPPENLEVWVSKNRHGDSGKMIKLNFNLKTQLIKDF